jgi:hypothetical protein
MSGHIYQRPLSQLRPATVRAPRNAPHRSSRLEQISPSIAPCRSSSPTPAEPGSTVPPRTRSPRHEVARVLGDRHRLAGDHRLVDRALTLERLGVDRRSTPPHGRPPPVRFATRIANPRSVGAQCPSGSTCGSPTRDSSSRTRTGGRIYGLGDRSTRKHKRCGRSNHLGGSRVEVLVEAEREPGRRGRSVSRARTLRGARI